MTTNPPQQIFLSVFFLSSEMFKARANAPPREPRGGARWLHRRHRPIALSVNQPHQHEQLAHGAFAQTFYRRVSFAA
jgi:hypothetical protein